MHLNICTQHIAYGEGLEKRLNSFVEFLFYVFRVQIFWRDNCSISDIQRKSKFSTPKFMKNYFIVVLKRKSICSDRSVLLNLFTKIILYSLSEHTHTHTHFLYSQLWWLIKDDHIPWMKINKHFIYCVHIRKLCSFFTHDVDKNILLLFMLYQWWFMRSKTNSNANYDL